MSTFDNLVKPATEQLFKTQESERAGKEGAAAKLQEEVANINVEFKSDPDRAQHLKEIAGQLRRRDGYHGLPINEVTFDGQHLVFHAPESDKKQDQQRLTPAEIDNLIGNMPPAPNPTPDR